MRSRNFLVAMLVLALAAPLAAEDKAKKKKPKRKRTPSVVRVPKGIELSGEQKEKLASINKEFAPKVAELRKKQSSVVSKEQLKARRDAVAAAKKAGKKGKELRAAGAAALKLTAEQKTQQAELAKAFGAIRKAAQEKFASILTDEQKAKLPKRGKKGGAKKKKKKKKDDA